MTDRTSRSTRTRIAIAALALTTLTALTIAGAPPVTAAPEPSGPTPPEHGGVGQRERKTDYDVRAATAKQRLSAQSRVGSVQRAAVTSLQRSLGVQGVVDLDPLTGTPRNLARLDGYLTRSSTRPAPQVALEYLRGHGVALGLTDADLQTLTLRKDYVDIAGIHHLSWIQSVDGVQVFGNGLKANVSKSGRLISLQGSPVAGLTQLAAAATTARTMSAAGARTAAAKDVGGTAGSAQVRSATARTTKWVDQDSATRVWYLTRGGLRPAWSTYVDAGGDLAYQHVLDAASGTVLYRHDTVDFENGDALVYDNYPGAAKGGTAKRFNLVDHGMLSTHATVLSGEAAVTFSDVNDNNRMDPGEEIAAPGTTPSRLVAFNAASQGCSAAYVCTWDQDVPYSWTKNRRVDGTNAFYLASLFRNYLKRSPFGFTRAAGNFDARDGDPVSLNALDGANSDGEGLPDADHIDNANMSTPPDGLSPTMQMFLWRFPGTSLDEDPFLPVSGAFDASILFHEYTHGLSNRLVVDPAGNSTLASLQAGAMGEAWSDYYAMDNLVTRGLVADSAAPGEVKEGAYVIAGGSFRTMPIDCPVTTRSAACTARDGTAGGYTYGQLSSAFGGAEVHDSGEIWAQTLWDLRRRLGHDVTGMIVTRAMELSPADPSYLDMRNAIVQADRVVYRGQHRDAIWKVFADRGMGFFAGSLFSGDVSPAEDFALPPAPGTARATLSGVVSDPTTGRPVPGATVAVTGRDSGFAGAYVDTTDSRGRYSIPGVYVGRYPVVAAYGGGYELAYRPVTVSPRGTRVDFTLRRDWAAASGGAEIADFDGPDYTDFGCGPDRAIDVSQGTGWGSTTGDDDGTPTNVMVPKSVVVELPVAVTVSSFAVDPSNTCGDPGSSSTGKYQIATSTNGTSWQTAKEGTFTAADRSTLVPLAPAAPVKNVKYVRFTMLSPQVPDFATSCPDGPFGGCAYTDMSELEVFGAAAGTP